MSKHRHREQARTRTLVAATVMAFLAAVRPDAARAQSLPGTAPASPSVPLSSSFSALGLAASLTAGSVGAFLMLWGGDVFGAPVPSMGPPAVDSFDARVTRKFGRRGSRRFLAGVTDTGGIYVLPALPFLFYGVETLALVHRGRPLLVAREMNPHHRLMAYAEALGFTLLTTGSVKLVVGRPRPYTEAAFNRPDLRHKGSEDNLSFFSGHASLSFAAGAFVTADVSRALLQGPLQDAGPTRRFMLGRLAPTLVGYGIPTLVGISRIADQQHWPSDVIVGALVGGLFGHLAYLRHLDGAGRPLVQLAQSLRPVLLAGPDERAGFALGLTARF